MGCNTLPISPAAAVLVDGHPGDLPARRGRNLAGAEWTPSSASTVKKADAPAETLGGSSRSMLVRRSIAVAVHTPGERPGTHRQQDHPVGPGHH